MTRKEIESQVIEIISDYTGVEKSVINADTVIDTDLGIDSLDHVELMMSIEKDFQISLTIDEICDTQKVDDVVDLIMEKYDRD